MNPRPVLICAFLATGCRGDLIVPTCVETSRVDVSDEDSAALGFSVDDLMAWAGGDHAATGSYEDDSPADVTVSLARGDGSAEVVTEEAAEDRKSGGGDLFSDIYEDIGVICSDPSLQFTTLLSVSTADGAVDLSVATDSAARDATSLGVGADIPVASMTGLPLPEGTITDGPCESGDPDQAFVDGSFEDDGTIGGQAGWEGEDPCSDGSVGSWARYTLTWQTTGGPA